MKLRQRAQRVFETIREGSQQSIRRIAAATGLPKSSVHRHKQAIECPHFSQTLERWGTRRATI